MVGESKVTGRKAIVMAPLLFVVVVGLAVLKFFPSLLLMVGWEHLRAAIFYYSVAVAVAMAGGCLVHELYERRKEKR